ncbi:MAG: c-type cytochrome [Pirellulales bacterium]
MSATVAPLPDLVKPQLDADLAKGIMEAVSKSEAAETGGEIVARIDEFTPEIRGRAIRVLLTRGPWAKSLVEAIEGSKVQLAELALDQKQALSEHPDRALAKRAQKLLSQGGGLPSADRQKVLAEFMPVTMQTGDADVGKQVFVKQCAKCHQHGELGNKVGPNLTGMAVHPKAELLTHILDPNRSVEGTYRVYTVQTGDGLILQGLLASESKTAIELFDAEGKKHQVLREDIETLKASPKSLMPEGFEKQVTKEELTNLLEFLTKRGKYLPLSIEKVATATSTKGMFINETADAERLIFPDWTPKTVDGIPFQLIDPQGTRVPNVVLLRGPKGTLTEKLPTSVTVPCNGSARAIHMLSGVSGWGFPYGDKNTVSMIVRITYEDGKVEDHPLRNGEHFADYIREVDVPKSKLAFRLRGQQIRYLAIFPQREAPLKQIELVKGPDTTAPVVMAITLEGK